MVHCIPCDLSSSLGLLCDLGQLSVAALVQENGGSLRRLEAVESPLGERPLSFSLLLTVILLGGEGRLFSQREKGRAGVIDQLTRNEQTRICVT